MRIPPTGIKDLFIHMSSLGAFRTSHQINVGGGDNMMTHQLSQNTNPIVHLTFFLSGQTEKVLFSAVSLRIVQPRSTTCHAIKALLLFEDLLQIFSSASSHVAAF
jgi:hypothetical protein